MKLIIDWPVCYKQELSEQAQASTILISIASRTAWVSANILDHHFWVGLAQAHFLLMYYKYETIRIIMIIKMHTHHVIQLCIWMGLHMAINGRYCSNFKMRTVLVDSVEILLDISTELKNTVHILERRQNKKYHPFTLVYLT